MAIKLVSGEFWSRSRLAITANISVPADEHGIMAVYIRLMDHFGPQGWWPGDGQFDTIVGAILTQAVTWKNVEKAIRAMKEARLFSLEAILTAAPEELAQAIKPALYHRQKAKKLRVMMEFIQQEYGGNYDLMFTEPIQALRTRFLSLWGIGPETADSILLYAGGYPVFVVDTYTRRIFARLGLVADNVAYRDLQEFLHLHSRAHEQIYNEYHALLVALGAQYWRKNHPRCESCPLTLYCRQRVVW